MEAFVDLGADFLRECVAEGMESLEQCTEHLLSMRNPPVDSESVAAVFRAFHSIKGNIGMAGLQGISHFAHVLESALDKIRQGDVPLTSERGELLVEGADHLADLLGLIDCERATETFEPKHEEYVARLEGAFSGGEAVWVGEADASGVMRTRLKAGRRPEAGGGQQAADNDEGGEAARGDEAKEGASGTPCMARSLRVEVSCIDALAKVTGELFHAKERLTHTVGAEMESQLGCMLGEIVNELDESLSRLYERLVDIRRVPVIQLTRPFERVVRDLCRRQEKRIRLVVEGGGLRVDKRALEGLHDPLVHLIRNAVDHGMEKPGERSACGKPEEGCIGLRFEEGEEHIGVTVEDDGRGIDVGVIREKAVSKAFVTEDEAARMDEGAVLGLLFRPGFSTAKEVTDVSGRGVGLDVVETNLRELGGSVKVESRVGEGTRFTLAVPKEDLPVTDGMVVRAGMNAYLIPMASIEALVDFAEVQSPHLLGKRSLAMVHDKPIPVLALGDAKAGERTRYGEPDRRVGVIVADQTHGQGLVVVDDIVGRRKVLVGNVSGSGSRAAGLDGAFILGDGTVGLAVSVEALFKQVNAGTA